MPNYSARDMLLRMAHGGPVHTPSGEPVITYGKGATAADLLAAEQRVLGEIAASPDTWDPAKAYNAILESGVTIDDAIAAGVKQSTIDAIFTSGASLPETAFSTPASIESSFTAYEPYAGQTTEAITSSAQQYLAKLMDDGVIDPTERREIQTIATERGVTFQDMLAAGVDPNIMFNVPAPKKKVNCPEGYVYNETVGACMPIVKKDDKKDDDKKDDKIPSCETGYTYDPVFKACVKDVKDIGCPTGYRFDEATQSCVEIFTEIDTDTGSGADSATGVEVYDPAGFGTDPSIYAPGEEALDRVFRDSAPRTEVIEDVMGTPQLTGFDYTPAAKLLSATGSGFSFTPPSVTGRPRSLMDTGTLNRYTRGRSAQDLRQLVGGDQARYDQYSGLLNNRGSYGGGLSRSQLYALTRQQDSQRRATGVSASTGTISDYLRLNPDIGVDYARAQAAGELPAGTTAESFALNHYNTLGRSEIAEGTRAPFTLAQGTNRTSPIAGGNNYFSAGMGGFEGEGDSDFTTRGYDNELLARNLGPAGGAIIRPVFVAEGGLVKKPKGFADGGPADSMTPEELTAQLMAMDAQEAPVPVQEPRPTDQVQTESRSLLENVLSGAKRIPPSVYEYGKEVVQSQSPSAKLLADIYKVGKTMQTGAADDPVGYALDMAPVTGEIRSGMDVEKFSDLANEARAAGDTEAAKMYEQLVTLSMAGTVPLMGMAARGAKRTAKAGAEAATQSSKMLDDVTRTTAQAPETPKLMEYPAEQLRTDPAVVNDPIAVRFNEQIAADPQAAIEQYKLIPKTKGGKILNADLWRELSPDYLADRSRAQNVHEPASAMNKVLYQQRLVEDMGQEGVWVFTGGGPASGKSAGLSDAAEDAADLVMDGTLAKFDKSAGLIDSAADSGKAVEIVYIDRDPQKAVTQMLDRAIDEGRPVPLDVFLDSHRDARSSIKRMVERYADDPRVNIEIWNNQGGKGEQFQTTIDNLSEMDYDTALNESLKVVDEYYATGKIDKKLYDAIKGDLQPRTGSAQEAVPSSNGGRNTQFGSLQDAQKQLGITEETQKQWRSTHSGVKQTRVPEVQEAAKQLREGKISTEEYQEIVREFQPIKPLAAVQQMPTLEDIAMALTKNPEKSAGIVGVNVDIPDGTPVASRLDIPAYESYDTWVVSLHDGTKSGGEAIGYGQAAVLNDVEFKSSAKGGLNIAAGEMPSGKPASKSTIARVYGSWENRPPENVKAMAEEIIRTNDPDWVEVGMNPFRHSYFYQKTDGMPVKSAEQVIQVGPLVLAKKPQTIPVESPEHLVKTPAGERYFKRGGSVERVHNDNRKYF